MCTHSLIDPQLQAKIFHAPAEMRHAIYAHLDLPNHLHIFLRNDRLQYSACIANDKHDLDGYERKTSGDKSSDTIWARRLQSTWGPHWECEEAVLQLNDKHGDSWKAHTTLPLVCKRMYLDIIAFMAPRTSFHSSDLETLGCLMKPQYQGPSAFLLAFSVVPRITRLSISLRLPLDFWRALEAETGAGSSTESWEGIVWRSMSDGITKLKKLKSLKIWLDHDGQDSWTMVNERALLSHLMPLSTLPNLDITLDCPKLHPKFETPQRHFTTTGSPPPFPIHRRLRQRYHRVEKDGRVGVIENPDFPILFPYVHDYVWPEKTKEEMEKSERDMWKNGEDVEGVIRECCS